MDKEKASETEYDKPIAYDVDGRPLYARPYDQQQRSDNNTQVVYVARPTDPKKQTISDATKLKHDHSNQVFPGLNLSEGEYVISAVRRHPIGLFLPFLIGLFLITLAFVMLFNLDLTLQSFQFSDYVVNPEIVSLSIILFIFLVMVGTYVAYYVYTSNKFFLTNESVIQEIQTGPFAKHEQTVSLADIEDASFSQNGIIQQMFNYGSIRLSTEGDETTYRFSYVSNPKGHIAVLNNAVEAFKNGRPVEDNKIN